MFSVRPISLGGYVSVAFFVGLTIFFLYCVCSGVIGILQTRPHDRRRTYQHASFSLASKPRIILVGFPLSSRPVLIAVLRGI